MKTFDYLQTEKAYKKLIAYRDKYGFIRLECFNCHKEFICSGHCLSKRKGLYFATRNVGCLCDKCDMSKWNNSKWFKNCCKGEEVETLIRLLVRMKRKVKKEKV